MELTNTYTALPKLFYTHQHPTPMPDPKLVIFNQPLADSLNIAEETATFAGNHVTGTPIAQAYAGHQFGHFTKLGDGRAVLLGEIITPTGTPLDIQLKGSGRTPYSRGGDGRATLAPMLREYIMSEAIHALGIPTTRSLAVVTTGETIQRQSPQPGAILTRLAASHIRVGTFEYAAHFGTPQDLRALADYSLNRHYPQATSYGELLQGVVAKQAKLIAQWQLVGFIHGVMNTDNMAISGETIDYGPCAFMDTYHPATVFSSIDRQGRYAYQNQPAMAIWNLARFGETLLPLLSLNETEAIEMATATVNTFWEMYHQHWLQGMGNKLGISPTPEDKPLFTQLLQLLQQHKADYINAFRALTLGEAIPEIPPTAFAPWHQKWQARRTQEKSPIPMQRYNLAIIPRNYYVEAALEAANQGNLAPMEAFLEALQDPYGYTQAQEQYVNPPSICGYQTFCGT